MQRACDVDWSAHRQRWQQWWAGELERPLVILYRNDPWPQRPTWWSHQLGAVPDTVGPDEIAAAFADRLTTQWYCGDQYPHVWIDYGPGVVAAALGGTLHADGSTTWFGPGIHADTSLAEIALPALGGPWWDRVQAVTQACITRLGTTAVVGHTDLGGGLDILASLRGTDDLLYDCMDQPEQIERLAPQITERWWQAYLAQAAIIEPAGMGTTPWAPIWSPGRCYMLQCDFAYMISPDHFARFVLPDLASLCARLDHGFYHLDGKGQLPHLDLLLSLTDLKGVQWIPGDGNPDAADPCWWPVLRRIRESGKLVQIFTTASRALRLAREQPTDGFVLALHNDLEGIDDDCAVALIRQEAERYRRG